jgi:hypothetical protein
MKFAHSMLEGGAVRLYGNTQQQYCAVVTRPGRRAGSVLQHHMCSQQGNERPSVYSSAQELGQKLNG